MKTVSDIRNTFKTYIESNNEWPNAIKSILNREMGRRRSTRRVGGSLAMGAPLTYNMTPGADIGVYGRFPTEIATDPQGVQDLDVFYASALSRGCGVEDSSLKVPADMGSNKVGGRRASRRSRKGGATSPLSALGNSIGDTISTFGDHPYTASNVPNSVQGAVAAWKGSTTPIHTPSSPVVHTWKYYSDSVPGVLNPDNIITSFRNVDNLASLWDRTIPAVGTGSSAAPASAPAPSGQAGGKSRRKYHASRKRRITHRRRRYHRKL